LEGIVQADARQRGGQGAVLSTDAVAIENHQRRAVFGDQLADDGSFTFARTSNKGQDVTACRGHSVLIEGHPRFLCEDQPALARKTTLSRVALGGSETLAALVFTWPAAGASGRNIASFFRFARGYAKAADKLQSQ